MRFLEKNHRVADGERIELLLILAGAALLLIGSRFAVILEWLPGCPLRSLLGLPCPGCGLGHAALHALHFDVGGVLASNPLSLLVAPYILYRAVTAAFGLVAGVRIVSGWPRWWTRGYQAALVALWCLLGLVRTATFLWPGVNPSGWGMPGP